MKKIMIVFCAFLLAGCASPPQLSWSQAMKIKIHRYGLISERSFLPYFKKAGVQYPPSKLALLVFKRSKQLQIYAKQDGQWHYIRRFRVLAASGGPGPKLHDGDHQVPEGIYRIVELNPESRFDLSMHVSYPNAFDRAHAQEEGRTNLGGNIFIHGNKLSIGCVAIGDAAIQLVFPLVYKVGLGNVTVVIAPNDLRTQRPVYGRVHPKWLSELYLQILKKLQQFPPPR
ncbi:MAG: L,D-transpeptidase family protein [Gammaproteobacteria bacterium]|nr:L,D-transpeptidase family protein [Gammaproteobacteria bacterium]MCH9744001.1 L,D-transpeptidase family protein [Gammaproteobacteria bacterium]